MTTDAIVGIGSNLCGPIEQVQNAIARLSRLASTEVLAQSSLYMSSPQGPQDQQDFCNAVVLIRTQLSAVELLFSLQAIEDEFGRVKTRHWGERIIDLDIIFFGQDKITQDTPHLVVPHPYALERDFVVIPVLEVTPNWVLPCGTHLAETVNEFDSHNLQKLASP